MNKPEITAIACVSENLGIGNEGKLLFNIPDDMKFFRENTADSVIVMGRKTLDSFPGGKPLKGRVNVVLTRQKDFSRENTLAYDSYETLCGDIHSGKFGNKPVFIIGGGEIYKLFLPVTDNLLITKVNQSVLCDSYFPEFSNEFVNISQSETFRYGDLTYTFNRYERRGR
jgi:dihydrofolate reductase